ncbi:MAG: glycosyltransferase family 2 protein [Ruminococcaceae bacterium]|nr:glycosyltransferase family 2 protein [Oscillospiraceae bacterium]
MKISVALCTYNGEKYITEQLQSILNQTVSVDEIVICDDNSKDKTVSICEEILNKSGLEYKIIVNESSLGVAKNFLKALKLTTGDYIFTCDQDDIWNQNKVEIFIREAEKSNRMLYFSNGKLVDGENRPLNKSLWEFLNIDYSEIKDRDSQLDAILKRPIVTGAAMCVSRELINKVDAIPEEWLHDEWFSIIASAEKSIMPINEETFNYRQHGNNVVGATKKSFKEGVATWLEGFNSILEFRRFKQKRSVDILNYVKNTEFEGIAQEHFDYWNGLNELKSLSAIKQISKTTKYFFSGKYHKYFVGSRGYVRDLFVAVLVKKQ